MSRPACSIQITDFFASPPRLQAVADAIAVGLYADTQDLYDSADRANFAPDDAMSASMQSANTAELPRGEARGGSTADVLEADSHAVHGSGSSPVMEPACLAGAQLSSACQGGYPEPSADVVWDSAMHHLSSKAYRGRGEVEVTAHEHMQGPASNFKVTSIAAQGSSSDEQGMATEQSSVQWLVAQDGHIHPMVTDPAGHDVLLPLLVGLLLALVLMNEHALILSIFG